MERDKGDKTTMYVFATVVYFRCIEDNMFSFNFILTLLDCSLFWG